MDLCLPLCRAVFALSLVICGRKVYGLPFQLAQDEYPSSWILHEPQSDFLAALQMRECLNRGDGIHPASTNPCRHYVVCSNQRVVLTGKCPPDRVFDASTHVCTHVWNQINSDSNCESQTEESDRLFGESYVSSAKKGLDLIEANGILKFLEKKPQIPFTSTASHKLFPPHEAFARIDSAYDIKKASEFARDPRQIKFGSFHPDYEYGSEFSGSVSKKMEARQIKLNPLHTQAYQLPPDFYWRRDF